MAKGKKKSTASPITDPGGLNPDIAAEAASAAASVKYLDQQALSWRNILKQKREIRKESGKINDLQQQLNKLGEKGLKEANAYASNMKQLEAQQKKLAEAKRGGGVQEIASAKAILELFEEREKLLLRTAGGRKQADIQQRQAAIASAAEEISLIEKINKKRTVSDRLLDIFRSKKKKQENIDTARAAAGGGANVAAEAGAGGKAGEDAALAAAGPYGAMAAAAKASIEKLKAPFKALGNEIKNALMAPLQSAAALISGDALGMGGGAVSGAGATSMLDGLQNIAKTIPFIGGLLGGLVGAFKAMVDAVLGVDQANMRVARTMNISKEAAAEMRESFDKTAAASDNIVVNSTRMLQSQVEIGNQLSINKQLSDDILVNDVKLRDIAGVEAGSRQAIAESSIMTGRSAASITKSVIGQVGAFNKMVGTSFKFSAILSEASKLSGVMGLTFSKYPEKILRATMGVKTMGLEMANLNGISDSLLDFESSISKEMEAQVLTGMDLNLTKAREAALNNDYLGVATEITKNVGSTANFLNMNRIRQEGIAAAMGMTADSLSDVLKKQDLYAKLGATDLKTAQARIALMEKEKGGREKIAALIGEAGYAQISEVSTAEKLAEVMEKIKKTFVDFLTKSGLFDFITNPERINNFIKGLTERLSGAVSLIGDIIASVLEAVAWLPGTDTEKWQGLADQVRTGASITAGGISSISNQLGGTQAESVGGTVQKGATQTAAQTAAPAQPYGVMAPAPTSTQPIIFQSVIDGQVVASKTYQYGPQIFG